MIEVQVETGGRGLPADPFVQAVRRALEAREVRDAEVSLTFMDDEGIRALNREHLDHDWATDVLSFALWEPGDPQVVGDVYVGYDQALRQAAAEGVEPREELLRLAVHGTLHVTGMDHPEDDEDRASSPMYRLQEALVADLLGEEGS